MMLRFYHKISYHAPPLTYSNGKMRDLHHIDLTQIIQTIPRRTPVCYLPVAWLFSPSSPSPAFYLSLSHTHSFFCLSISLSLSHTHKLLLPLFVSSSCGEESEDRQGHHQALKESEFRRGGEGSRPADRRGAGHTLFGEGRPDRVGWGGEKRRDCV